MDPGGSIAAAAPLSFENAESKTPTKSHSFSNPLDGGVQGGGLAPSPTFLERSIGDTHDQNTISSPAPSTPKASRRPEFLVRGLSLQMPADSSHPPPESQSRPAPLSPQLDRNNIYKQQSPATSLPRHSRGLDFSRASTTLHHSTLAESSPDSSPAITQRGVMIPGRKGSMSNMGFDSPGMAGTGFVGWAALPPERSAMSSSMGSVNMLASESESNDSEDDSMGGDDIEDPMFTTPQVRKLQNPNAPTPFVGAPSTPGGGARSWGTGTAFSPAQASLMKTIRRTRLQKNGKRSRKSSSSASGSGYSSMASPRTTSPPPLRSIESAPNGGYFNWPTAARSRRESLALGTDGLHLSSGNDSGDEASASNTPSTPGVVRRVVTRRGNLLPKTKGFARIKAALMEESAPVDTEVRREAETMQQVRERDGSITSLDLTSSERPKTVTAQSSPSLLPSVPEMSLEDDETAIDSDEIPKGLGMNFAMHAHRNSAGLDYWNRYGSAFRTPPPPNFARHSSSAVSDVNMDSSSDTSAAWLLRPRTRSSASDAPSETTQATVQPAHGVINDDMHLNRFKRRREDDFDISTIKRRAVSPGMSASNSPVLTHSPSVKDTSGNWGQPPERKDKSSQPPPAASDASQQALPSSLPQQSNGRQGSGGSAMSGGTPGGGKKLGLQGMVDTNDGLMKMSIE